MFQLTYPSFEELGRCCWFLFGNRLNNIDQVGAQFEPQLAALLSEPGFALRQRVAMIRRL